MILNRKADPWLVFILAFALRLLYVWQLSSTPFFDHPIVDAEYHDAWAREILRLGAGHEGVFFRAPLYPYFLTLIYSLTDGSYLAPRIAQAVLGGLTALLTYLLGYELTRRRNVSLMAGIGASLYGILVYFDGELLVETLFTPLFISSCLVYALARRGKKLPLYLATGVLLGLASITRPSSLVILPIFVTDQLFTNFKTWKSLIKQTVVGPIILLLIGGALPLAPVTWHNLHKGHDFVLIANQGGVNFYIGNNPKADGLHSVLPGLGTTWDVPAASQAAYEAMGRELKPSEVSAYYSRQGRQYILSQPLEAARLTLKKFCVFWNRLEVSNNRDLYFFMSETGIMPILRIVGFWLVGPLWFLGIIPVYCLSVVAFFVTARFRAPLIPFLLICAGVAVAHLISSRKPYFNRQSRIALAVLAGAFLFVNTNPWGLRKENPAHSQFALAGVYLKENNLEAARVRYQHALQADPRYPQAHLNLGVTAYRKGDLETAEREYLSEIEVNPGDAKAYNNLGAIRFSQKLYDEARAFYEKALELQPYNEDARLNLAQVFFIQGLEIAKTDKPAEAGKYFARAVELDGQKATYRYNYALALGKLGYVDKARRELEIALSLAPDFQAARELLEQVRSATSGGTKPQQ
jgi:tetratricopeptide (TPR) repeat protein